MYFDDVFKNLKLLMVGGRYKKAIVAMMLKVYKHVIVFYYYYK